jgi:hypothetical protein
VPRQFVGPPTEPDRYELVERQAVGPDGSERWLAAQWVDDRHVFVLIVTPSEGRVTPAAPPPLLESFEGPPPHEWGEANSSTTVTYDVRQFGTKRKRG